MNRGLLVCIIVLLIGIGAFTWLAVTDVPVEKARKSKIIPNERFFNAH